MRLGPFLGAAFAAVSAHRAAAQDLGPLFQGGADVLRREKLLEPVPGEARGQDVMEPRANPGLPPREGALPPPQGDNQRRIELIYSGGPWRNVGDKFEATGGIHIRYRGYDILADQVVGSTLTNIFTASGNVKVIGQDAVVTGETVTVNFDERSFRSQDADAQLRPSFLQGRVLDDVYLRGAVTYGTEREVWGEHSAFTTCNLDHPHYELLADRSDIRPGRRAILRKVTLEVLNKKILTVPYVSVPLDPSGDRYMPEVGQSPDEGYYIRNYIGIPTRSSNDNLVGRLDYMTKLGTGLGGNYNYLREGAMVGAMRLYSVLGQIDTLNFSNQHEQRIGRGTLRIENDYQRNNYFNAPQSSIWTARSFFDLPQGGATNTRLSFNRASNESGGFRTLNQVWGINDQRQWNSRTTTTATVNYSQVSSGLSGGNSVERENVDLQLRARHDMQKALAEFEYIRSIPVGTVQNFFSPADRTPVFALRSDARRLFGQDFAQNFNFNTELSVGEFVASRTRDRVGRANFDLNFTRPDVPSRRSSLSFSGRFKQGVYSDDTAQYVAGLGLNYRYRLGRDTGLNVRYNFLRPYGFTPLSLDRVGRTNFMSMDLNFRPIRALMIGAQTGYDFLLEEREQIAWQPIALRAEYQPTDWLQMRALSTYDPARHAYSNTRLDFAYYPGATRVSAGFRYDGLRHTWSNANVYIDGFKWGRLMASAILSYNGYLRKFEAQHYSFTYDLHCAELIVQVLDNPVGFRSGREVTFFVRLKAFPFDTPFGIGRRGQGVGTGVGSGY
jgi:hypothetical protein